MAAIWQEEFKVRSYEVGPKGLLSMQSICNYLQEIAGNHAHQLGVAVDQLLKNNITWVLSRLHVQMQRYPFWREVINVKTWPATVDHLYAIRDYELYDTQERLLGKATSSWMLLDVIKRKPIPITENIKQMHEHSPGRALDDNFGKLPEMQQAQYEKVFHVRLSDLDLNQHVNNVTYIEWGLETIPPEIRKEYFLANMEITFRAESRYGDCIHSQSESRQEGEQLLVIHQLFRKADNKELARLRTQWVKISKKP